MALLDENGTADTMGHVTSLFNRPHQPGLWVAGQLLKPTDTIQKGTHILQSDIARLKGKLIRVKKTMEWDYLPHVDSHTLKDGFLNRLASIQGEQNIWWAGSLMNFESVEGNAAFARLLVSGSRSNGTTINCKSY